jgi:hypothetical protein
MSPALPQALQLSSRSWCLLVEITLDERKHALFFETSSVDYCNTKAVFIFNFEKPRINIAPV